MVKALENKFLLVEEGIKNVMVALNIDRMPTRPEIEVVDSKVYSRIQRTGGIIKWADRLGLPLKTPQSATEKNYDDKDKIEYIKDEILSIIKKLNIDRMPSFSEIKESYGNASKLLNLIRRNGGYRYWAEKLNLPLKECETNLGVDYEEIIAELMREKGFEVIQTPIKHPYDLLVNGVTKVDVKVANLYLDKNKNTSFYKFGLHKELPQSDFYILVSLNENEEIFKILVIPSHKLKMNVVSIGINSKYDVYEDRWDLIESHSNFINQLK